MDTKKIARSVWSAYQSSALGFLFAGLLHLAWVRGDRIALLFIPAVLAAIMNAVAPVAREIAEGAMKRPGGPPSEGGR